MAVAADRDSKQIERINNDELRIQTPGFVLTMGQLRTGCYLSWLHLDCCSGSWSPLVQWPVSVPWRASGREEHDLPPTRFR